MRKGISAILSLVFCGALMLGGCSFVNLDKGSSVDESKEDGTSSTVEKPSDSEEEEVTLVYNAELGGYFTNMANGNTLYVNTKAVVETTNSLSGTIIGEVGAGEVVIDGMERGATLTATGQGIGSIQGAEGVTLVFKNLTIRDNSIVSSSTADRREGYLEFGGKLRFENCKFACAVYLCDDADANFVNCEFDSGAEDMYAMWISDGSAHFKDCEFTGWRAIKLYEGSDNKYTSVQSHFDVETVIIDGCIFEGLKKKPGLAIDVFQGKETTVIIQNCEFYGCQGWKTDSYEGLLSVYESKVDTSTITMVIDNVISEGLLVEWETDREFGTGVPNA